MKIRIKRVREPWSEDDGFRVLVDRLWPRGVGKDEARIDLWYKDIAPSHDLRKWFHLEQDWLEFRRRYLSELKARPEIVAAFRALLAGREKVTLLYGAKDEEHNQAALLLDFFQAGQPEI